MFYADCCRKTIGSTRYPVKQQIILLPGKSYFSLLTAHIADYNIKLYHFFIQYFTNNLEVKMPSPLILGAFTMVLAFIGFLGTLCWTLFGSLFHKFFLKNHKSCQHYYGPSASLLWNFSVLLISNKAAAIKYLSVNYSSLYNENTGTQVVSPT